MSAALTGRFGADIRPTFPRVTRSEWIKLRTLRSSVWTAIMTVVIMAAFAGLFAWAITEFPEGAPSTAGILVVGYPIAQLTIAVLGALVITGEYATGAFRSTLAAEPRRLRVVASKGLMLVLAACAISVVAIALSAAVTLPILQAGGLEVSFDGDGARVLIGGALYLTLSALFAYGIGLLLRNSAAAITTVVGVLFVLPIIAQILVVTTGAEWMQDVYQYLPSIAGSAVVSGDAMGVGSLEPWTGFAVFAGYTALSLVAGTIAFARRDD